ncbi:MAG: T9SS type A sorting domain-containing protein [Bacteroidales bacterium]
MKKFFLLVLISFISLENNIFSQNKLLGLDSLRITKFKNNAFEPHKTCSYKRDYKGRLTESIEQFFHPGVGYERMILQYTYDNDDRIIEENKIVYFQYPYYYNNENTKYKYSESGVLLEEIRILSGIKNDISEEKEKHTHLYNQFGKLLFYESRIKNITKNKEEYEYFQDTILLRSWLYNTDFETKKLKLYQKTETLIENNLAVKRIWKSNPYPKTEELKLSKEKEMTYKNDQLSYCLTKSYDPSDNSKIIRKTETNYENGNKVKEISYELKKNILSPKQKTINTFYKNSSLLKECSLYYYSNNEWEKYFYRGIEYNKKGYETKITETTIDNEKSTTSIYCNYFDEKDRLIRKDKKYLNSDSFSFFKEWKYTSFDLLKEVIERYPGKKQKEDVLYTYDPEHRLLKYEKTVIDDQGLSSKEEFIYTFDNEGNIVKVFKDYIGFSNLLYDNFEVYQDIKTTDLPKNTFPKVGFADSKMLVKGFIKTEPSSQKKLKYQYFYSRPTSVSEISNTFKGRIYPNPSHGVLYIELKEPSSNAIVEIFDMKGQRIYFQHFNSKDVIDTSKFEIGTYICLVYGNGSTYSRKILISGSK